MATVNREKCEGLWATEAIKVGLYIRKDASIHWHSIAVVEPPDMVVKEIHTSPPPTATQDKKSVGWKSMTTLCFSLIKPLIQSRLLNCVSRMRALTSAGLMKLADSRSGGQWKSAVMLSQDTSVKSLRQCHCSSCYMDMGRY